MRDAEAGKYLTFFWIGSTFEFNLHYQNILLTTDMAR
jgi:hypothetical protein